MYLKYAVVLSTENQLIIILLWFHMARFNINLYSTTKESL